HNGYEEIATDPSYYGQIIVMCAPQQGNYGVDNSFWESRQLWIRGFICLDIQKSAKNSGWLDRLNENAIPAMEGFDTRELVLHLREQGTLIGAMVQAGSQEEALEKARPLISQFKEIPGDWVHEVSRKESQVIQGCQGAGPRVAVLDYGCKENILRELIKRSREIKLFPSRATVADIEAYNPDGILLSNGPGDPGKVEGTVETVQHFLGKTPLFGICMGHQILGRAFGAKTYRLKFGHRGANHPVKDLNSGEIFMTSQNHGYAITQDSLPDSVKVTHVNLNDQTVSGIASPSQSCFSVQYHPESHPGPRDAETLFDQFVEWMEQ
ncbi:MAG: glutamine-hydrolyzing carbamoyl-phosphate synthase small subunit, partial [Pseudomonadota bacterium]